MSKGNFDLVRLLWQRKVRRTRKMQKVSGVPPLSFKAFAAGTLENYRIYGNTVNGENVGDLITEGEHAGEYSVPVTVEGKNLLQNTATSQTKNGVTFTVNSDGSVTCNGTTTNTIYFAVKANVALESGTYVLTGCPLGGGQNTFKLYAQTTGGAIFYVDEGAGAIINYKSKITILITILSGYTCNNLTFYPMIRKADIEDDTYEPYHAPVTVPIYLPEPIKMVGDEAEYIDYAEQKMHRIGADDIDVTLPALPTLTGTNVLSVGTAVQPSRVEVKGRIKAVGQETEPEPEAAEPEPEAAEAEPETAEPEQETAEAEQE